VGRHRPAPRSLTGRRADGYHDLQTVFQLIDLADDIQIRVRCDGVIERPSGPEGVAAEADLVVRAARALQRATGTKLGADLSLTKRIPLGGGLGGGSSDAATVLVALVISCIDAPLGPRDLALLRRHRTQLEATRDHLIADNASLAARTQRLQSDDAYLQRLIRRELGYARADELVYRFGANAQAAAPRFQGYELGSTDVCRRSVSRSRVGRAWRIS